MRMCLGFLWTGLLLVIASHELNAQNGMVIITELLPNPDAVSDANGEWFEIYNTRDSSINLKGWQLGDLGSDLHTISRDLWISPASYLLFGRKADTLLNGGIKVDYEYSGFILNNTQDVIMLWDSLGNLVDSMAYNDPSPAGKSMALSARKLDLLSRDSLENWCHGVAIYGSGDRGSPGTINLSCNLNTGDLVITELMIDPTKVDDVDGEWFEIFNRSGFRQNLKGLIISDLDEDYHQVGEDVGIESHDHFLFLRNADSLRNGGLSPGYDYDGVLLANNVDELIIAFDSVILDIVSYDRSLFPISQGRSMGLDEDYFDPDMNDHFGYWCRSSINYGLGDRGTPGETNELCSVLPVNLVQFSASVKETGILITWRTTFEENNSYFTLFHSPDGLDYIPIGNFPGHETSRDGFNYQYFHKRPNLGKNFYSLRQTDLDGTEEYFDAIRIDYSKIGISIFPNPTSGFFTIGSMSKIDRVTITSMDGSWQESLTAPYNVSHLLKGVYLLRINCSNGIQYAYLIKT